MPLFLPFLVLATVLFITACRLLALCGGDSSSCVLHWPRLGNYGPWKQKEKNQGNKSIFKFRRTIEKTEIHLTENGLRMVEIYLVPSLASAVLDRPHVYVFLGKCFHV